MVLCLKGNQAIKTHVTILWSRRQSPDVGHQDLLQVKEILADVIFDTEDQFIVGSSYFQSSL